MGWGESTPIPTATLLAGAVIEGTHRRSGYFLMLFMMFDHLSFGFVYSKNPFTFRKEYRMIVAKLHHVVFSV